MRVIDTQIHLQLHKRLVMNISVTLNILLVVLQARKQYRVEQADGLIAVWAEHHEQAPRDERGGPRAAHQSRKRLTDTRPQSRQRTIDGTLSLTHILQLRPDIIITQTVKQS